jgi:uncharacterized protein
MEEPQKMDQMAEWSSEQNLGSTTPARSRAERAGFPDWILVYGWILIAFFLFQIFAAIFVFVGVMQRGAELTDLLDPAAMISQMDILFLGNSVGQILVFGGLTLLMIRFVSRTGWSEFLPLVTNSNVWKYSGLAALVVLIGGPAIWLMAWLNSLIPLPRLLVDLEQQQTQMIESFLKSDFNLSLALFHVALVPAICEEILYRGFALRLLQRTKTIWVSILITGIIFGLYHLRLSQFIPLATIGIFLGWITIRSGSIIPAVVAHFVNNASSVTLVKLMPDSPLSSSVPEMPPIWLALLSIMFVSALLYYIHTFTRDHGGEHVWKSTQ